MLPSATLAPCTPGHRARTRAHLAGWAIVPLLVAAAAGELHGSPSFVSHQSEVLRAADPRAVADWITDHLPATLNLEPSDSLTMSGSPRHLGDWVSYAVRRSVSGIPVVSHESRLLVNPKHGQYRWLGNQPPLAHVSRTWPELTSTEALNLATRFGKSLSAPRLVYRANGGLLTLNYEVDLHPNADRSRAERLYIDSRTGAIVDRLPLVHHAAQRRVYDHASACRSARVRSPVGPKRSFRLLSKTISDHLSRSEESGPSGNTEVEAVYNLLGQLHEFFEEVLELDSYDGRGGTLHSIVRVRFHDSRPEIPQCVGDGFTAFWVETARTAVFPRQVSRLPEVIGHEFGHALISNGSRLIYKHESGALNESIADAIGITFRTWLDSHQDLEAPIPDHVWKLRSEGGVIRDIQDPRRVNNLPNHYLDYRHLGKVDHGGVHVNSSILNQAFYLLAQGGRRPGSSWGPEVEGIGISKAVKIFGQAGLNTLTPNSDFRDARYAFALVAEVLYGQDSAEWVATHTAMDAVGIPGYWARPPSDPEATTHTSSRQDAETSELPPSPPAGPDAGGGPGTDQQAEPAEDQNGPIPPGKKQDSATDARQDAPPPGPVVETPPMPEEKPPTGPATSMPERQSPPGPVQATPEPAETPADDETPDPPSEIDVVRQPPTSRTESRPMPSKADPPASPPAETAQSSVRPVTIWALAIVLLLFAIALHMVRSAARRRPAKVAPTPAAVHTYGLLRSPDGAVAIPLGNALLKSKEGLVIGRSSQVCHAQIKDPTVSRRHLRCRIARGDLMVEDLNSAAGTLVDGTRIKPFRPVKLRLRQPLTLGATSLTLTDEG